MNHQVRVIVMDKPLPKLDSLIADPRYNGHSVGHWDGDTLVVESAGFNDDHVPRCQRPASQRGHEHASSASARLGDRLEDVITIHDPQMYAERLAGALRL